MTKLLVATFIFLGAVSVNAAPCNPEQSDCAVVSKYPAPYTGPAFVPVPKGWCHPDQEDCMQLVTPAGVPVWLKKLNDAAPKSWQPVNPFNDNTGN